MGDSGANAAAFTGVAAGRIVATTTTSRQLQMGLKLIF
jgi:hypothetical protein